ncbi:MAG: hypothetical protein CSA52_02980 [Gammaproteobacteria bacterium]|nr:MAG: hypothetical protein CSB48_03715 [Pseudomonadota bacterium]PIE38161.1 MAG: hypothetical protein CSA52_02980 [Gammaproteobacteria bacterium]
MTDEVLFRVILQGYKPDKGTYYVEQDLAKLFKIEPAKAKKLLASAPCTLKDNLSEASALRYKAAVEQTGARCEIEDNRYDFSGLSIQ